MAESVADADFERRARLALVWQDLVTPVRAIVDYQEIAIEEGRRLGLTDELPFLEKALVAAGSLSAMVNRLRDPGSEPQAAAKNGDLGGVQERLRHDFRTPLNAIIGYSEMVLEDLADTEAGEVPAAFIVPRKGCTLDEAALNDYFSKRLAGYKMIRRWHLTDAIPRTPSGKILRRVLRDKLL